MSSSKAPEAPILGPTRVIVGDSEFDFWIGLDNYATIEKLYDEIRRKLRRYRGYGLNGIFKDRELSRPVTTLDEIKNMPVMYADRTAMTLKEMKRLGLGLGLKGEEAQW